MHSDSLFMDFGDANGVGALERRVGEGLEAGSLSDEETWQAAGRDHNIVFLRT